METIETTFLDVTTLNPPDKHPTIFRMFDALKEGQTLTIRNDHDPKPLYYQLVQERGNILKWEYLENGPVWWKVRITKKATEEDNETVGELAARNIASAKVFKTYGIDFCCGGKKTLKEVCTDRGLDPVKVREEIRRAETAPASRPTSYQNWPLNFLCDYIENTHHTYVRETLPELVAIAEKVEVAHGVNHPELAEIKSGIDTLAAELSDHMLKEEKILFPYVRDLVLINSGNLQFQLPHFGKIDNPISMMESEHEAAGQILQEIRELSNNFSLPADACTSFKMLYTLIQEFEDDLHIHIHLENNVLFPKASALDQAIREKNR